MNQVQAFERALLSLDRLAARQILVDANIEAAPIAGIEALVVPALEHIGKEWEQGRLALSQVYMSGRICEELIETILPAADPRRRDQPKIAICVLEDYHLLGKRIVHSMLQACGYRVRDYGRIGVDEVVERARSDEIQVLLISVLMLPSALHVKEVRERLDPAIKIVVGGAPFRLDEQLWRQVGADAMGRDAAQAVEIVDKMTGGG